MLGLYTIKNLCKIFQACLQRNVSFYTMDNALTCKSPGVINPRSRCNFSNYTLASSKTLTNCRSALAPPRTISSHMHF